MIRSGVMASTAPKRATYADVLAAPPNAVAQVVHGVLYTHPRPAGPHANAASVLGMDLGGAFHRGRGGPGGWIILDEPELHLLPARPPVGDVDVLVPDLVGWRRERMAAVPDAPYFTLPPDWACEVLSRSTAALDRSEKMEIYAAAGVEHAWLVDPTARTLEAYRRQDLAWLRLGTWRDDARVRVPPFDAIELELSALWPAQSENL